MQQNVKNANETKHTLALCVDYYNNLIVVALIHFEITHILAMSIKVTGF